MFISILYTENSSSLLVFLYGFINQVLRKDCIYYEYKELFQELIIVLMNCIERYDEDNGCFYYFVKKAAERKLYNLLSKIARKNRVLSLDDSFYDDAQQQNTEFYQQKTKMIINQQNPNHRML